MMSDLKAQILQDIHDVVREELGDYEDEMRGLAQGLARRLLREGKGKADVATDPRVIEWARTLPLESPFAEGALCWMVEEAMMSQAEKDERLLRLCQNPAFLADLADLAYWRTVW